MATNLLDIVAPGLGSTLNVLLNKFNELKEGKELCARLHHRIKEFANELGSMPTGTLQKEDLLRRLQDLIAQYSKSVTTFAEQRNLVKRVLKVRKFIETIKLYNERLDSIIAMITVNQTAKLIELLNWRTQYDRDAASVVNQLAEMGSLQREIWDALKQVGEQMLTKRDIENMVLMLKRDAAESQEQTPQPLDRVLSGIVKIAEKDILKDTMKTPPTWLIDPDEVNYDVCIDSEGVTSIYAGDWQGVRVAVKNFNVIEDENPVFNKQVNIWRTLLHPHVAQLYGAGSDNGAPFIVYEYASHQSLDRCWEKVSQRELWRMLHQAALGLAYLHNKRIVHGNLSCSKLLVTEQRNVKLFGFGASYIRDNYQSNSLNATTREEFAAPECVGIGPDGNSCGKSHSPRFESDIYTFGLTIIEAVTKKDPFSDKSFKEVKMLKKDIQGLQPEEMSEDAWTLVKQMCPCDPSQRASLACQPPPVGIRHLHAHAKGIEDAGHLRWHIKTLHNSCHADGHIDTRNFDYENRCGQRPRNVNAFFEDTVDSIRELPIDLRPDGDTSVSIDNDLFQAFLGFVRQFYEQASQIEGAVNFQRALNQLMIEFANIEI